MVANCAFAAGSLVLSLIGSSLPRAIPYPQGFSAASAVAVTDSFSPPPKTKKRRPAVRSAPQGAQPNTESGDDFTEEASPTPRRPTPSPSARRRVAPRDQEQDGSAAAATDDDEDERPRVRRRSSQRKAEDEDEAGEGQGEDTEDHDDESFASLPVIVPRLVSFGAGASAVGRQFQFNTAALQKEATLRSGGALFLEAYPLIRLSRSWFNKIGVGISYSLELGAAAKPQTNGSSSSFPVKQQRWSIDLRYAIPIGARVVVIPALGYGGSTFDVQRPTPVPPSLCNGMSVGPTDPTVLPCLANVQTGLLIADVHLRIAATSTFSLSLTGGYLLGLVVGKGVGQIGSEASSTSFGGFHGDLAARFMISSWLAVQANIPFATTAYKFSGFSNSTAPYQSASETYYGLTVGAVVFTQ